MGIKLGVVYNQEGEILDCYLCGRTIKVCDINHRMNSKRKASSISEAQEICRKAAKKLNWFFIKEE